jgi:short-subunit dehydrogenase
LPQVRFSVYAASKAYVLSLSNALGAELRGRGIYVTAVCPGPVKTEFFDIAESKGSTMKVKKLFMISPKKVVRTALKDSLHRKTISIPSLPMKAFRIITKVVPESVLLKAMVLMYGGKKKACGCCKECTCK